METIEFQAKIKNGVIEIPGEYSQELNDSEMVEVTIKRIVKKKRIAKTGIIARLIENPILVENFKPLTREEAHDRNL
jgi:hypothetical protein